MNRRTFLTASAAAAALGLAGCATTSKSAANRRCYELRIYYSPPGRLDDLHARFRNHTMKLFTKHGIQSIGYWVPMENSENKLVYLVAFPSPEAREASWKAFGSDPEWQVVVKKTEADGRIVTKAEVTVLQTTDYSPVVKTGNVSNGGIFELRAYTTPPGRLPNLDARFREYTVKLFARHGIGNWGYFHKMAGQPGADTSLIYFLSHKSREAGQASFDSFRKDPAWIAARAASEKAAGGSLTVPDGVKSQLLVPTDYSPTK